LHGRENVASLIESIDASHIRNFSIVAHIDHGKTTLSGALLALTQTTPPGTDKLSLDGLTIERQRGITIKAHIVSMLVKRRDEVFLVNLIDTPGHVDFSYEVSRALNSCEGAVLLVDVTQGIQAQTLANYATARKCALTVVPALNKIDSPNADVDGVLEQLTFDLELDPAHTALVSARESIGVAELLDSVLTRVPAPVELHGDGLLRALLIDSYFDRYSGVVCLVRVFDGVIQPGQAIKFASKGVEYVVNEVGFMHPNRVALPRLRAGMVGYVICGLRQTREARVGDTLLDSSSPSSLALKGFEQPQPMLFAGIFPEDPDGFDQLKDAIERLTLNDASVRANACTSAALGAGFRCGFLGALHFEVFCERLEAEYGIRVVTTRPSVPFMVRYLNDDGSHKKDVVYDSPADFPEYLGKKQLLEPTCVATVVCPAEMQGPVRTLMADSRAAPIDVSLIGSGTSSTSNVRLRYHLPLSAVVSDGLPAKLKAGTRGYASLDYVLDEYKPADLVRLDILVHHEPVDAFACVIERSQARHVGSATIMQLKELLPRQQFIVALQAAIGNKVIARESVSAVRKNVISRIHGGGAADRKAKLLDKQKEGKKRMKAIGGVAIEHEVFLTILKKRGDQE
jgi:GTP-binding protein LepA